ncbi:MAG: hypothetical protein O2894_10510 [Planctomycetota bacterium]|nr:hypothetical protein [Planctomycetota bacterium]
MFACVLDGEGGARFGTWDLVHAWSSAAGVLWVHLDLRGEATVRWIREQSGLDEITQAALLAIETRPRATVRGNGLLVNLRGVNSNPGAEPDDMVSVRVWLEESRIITVRRRRLGSAQDVKQALEQGDGPNTPGEFLFHLADHVLLRVTAHPSRGHGARGAA